MSGQRWLPQRPEAILNLTIDALTGRVVAALRAGGVPCLLLKGPVVARRLYADDEVRPYADCDLLVRQQDLGSAERIVAGLGLTRSPAAPGIPGWMIHHANWHLAGRHFELELHWTLIHLRADPDVVWAVCTRDGGTLVVGGVEVPVPGDGQLALNLALHAAQHADDDGRERTAEDLRRAIERLPAEVWPDATRRAVELDAVPGLAAGLRLLPAGAALARTLALPDAPSAEVLLTTGRLGPDAKILDAFLRTPGVVGKARFARFVLFPPPAGPAPAPWVPVSDEPRRPLRQRVVRYPARILRGIRAWRRARRAT